METKNVEFKFTGGYPMVDTELIREGFKIGETYKGKYYKHSSEVRRTAINSNNECVFYIGVNCTVTNLFN